MMHISLQYQAHSTITSNDDEISTLDTSFKIGKVLGELPPQSVLCKRPCSPISDSRNLKVVRAAEAMLSKCLRSAMDSDNFDMYGDLSESIASKPPIDASLTIENGKGSAASEELVEEVRVKAFAALLSNHRASKETDEPEPDAEMDDIDQYFTKEKELFKLDKPKPKAEGSSNSRKQTISKPAAKPKSPKSKIPMKVTSMHGLFENMKGFNEDISNWNVSNVADMNSMFAGCKVLNCDISGWNVGKVKVMEKMFYRANNFNRDLSNWNVSSVNMRKMFKNADKMNLYTIESWDLSGVTWNEG